MRLNRIIYPAGSIINATVTVDPSLVVTNKYLFLSSGESQDAEVVPLEQVGATGVYVTTVGIPIVLNDGTAPSNSRMRFIG